MNLWMKSFVFLALIGSAFFSSAQANELRDQLNLDSFIVGHWQTAQITCSDGSTPRLLKSDAVNFFRFEEDKTFRFDYSQGSKLIREMAGYYSVEGNSALELDIRKNCKYSDSADLCYAPTKTSFKLEMDQTRLRFLFEKADECYGATLIYLLDPR